MNINIKRSRSCIYSLQTIIISPSFSKDNYYSDSIFNFNFKNTRKYSSNNSSSSIISSRSSSSNMGCMKFSFSNYQKIRRFSIVQEEWDKQQEREEIREEKEKKRKKKIEAIRKDFFGEQNEELVTKTEKVIEIQNLIEERDTEMEEIERDIKWIEKKIKFREEEEERNLKKMALTSFDSSSVDDKKVYELLKPSEMFALTKLFISLLEKKNELKEIKMKVEVLKNEFKVQNLIENEIQKNENNIQLKDEIEEEKEKEEEKKNNQNEIENELKNVEEIIKEIENDENKNDENNVYIMKEKENENESWTKVERQEIISLSNTLSYLEKQFDVVCKKHGLSEYIPEIGSYYEPVYQIKVSEIIDHNKKPGTISHVISNGYMVHKRLIEPAHVKVYSKLPRKFDFFSSLNE